MTSTLKSGFIYIMEDMQVLSKDLKIYRIGAFEILTEALRLAHIGNPRMKIRKLLACRDVEGCQKKIKLVFSADQWNRYGLYMIHDMDDCERRLTNIHLEDFVGDLDAPYEGESTSRQTILPMFLDDYPQ